MALDDRLEEMGVDKHDAKKVWEDRKKFDDKNRHAIITQGQSSLDKAYSAVEKAAKDAFTPDDKKKDESFDFSAVKIKDLKDNKDKVYKTLNAFAEEFFKTLKWDGTVKAAKEYKKEKDKFGFYQSRFDQLVSANAGSDKGYDPNDNPTMALLSTLAESMVDDKDATVATLIDQIRGYKNNPALADRMFRVKSTVKLDGLMKDMNAIGLSLGLKGMMDKAKLEVDKPELFYNPNGSRTERINLYGAIAENRLDDVAKLAKTMGLKAKYN